MSYRRMKKRNVLAGIIMGANISNALLGIVFGIAELLVIYPFTAFSSLYAIHRLRIEDS